MNLSELTEDKRFIKNSDRVQNSAALRALLGPVMARRTTQEWIELLRASGIPCGRVQSVDEVCANPQVNAREMIKELHHAKVGPIKVTGVPIKLSETPGEVSSPPPVLGEHSSEVLAQWLNIGQNELDALAESKVV